MMCREMAFWQWNGMDLLTHSFVALDEIGWFEQ